MRPRLLFPLLALLHLTLSASADPGKNKGKGKGNDGPLSPVTDLLDRPDNSGPGSTGNHGGQSQSARMMEEEEPQTPQKADAPKPSLGEYSLEDKTAGPAGAGSGETGALKPVTAAAGRKAEEGGRLELRRQEPAEGGPEVRGWDSGSGAQAAFAAPEGTVALPAHAEAAPEARRAAAELVGSARRKIGLSDFRGALDDLSRSIAADPAAPAGWTRRAEAYNRMGQYESARADALESLRRDPASASAWTQLSFAEMRLGRLAQARQASAEAVRLNARSATAHYVKYLVEGKSGQWTDALAALETASQLNPKFTPYFEKVRGAGRFIDPDDESSLGDPLPGQEVPFWIWGLIGALVLLAAGLAAALALRGRSDRVVLVPAGPKKASNGRLAGKYELGQMIGRGGMGNVYHAVDHSLGRPVAIKKMSARLTEIGAEARELLIKEAKTVANIRHPSIVAIHEIVEEDGDLYLVFELVEGKTVQQLLAERGRLEPGEIAEIMRPVCAALEFAHNGGLVHRDVKPANVMLTRQGHVKLMDFGVARSLGEAGTRAPLGGGAPSPFARTQSVIGTPQYMAPEGVQGLVSPQGDVFALAVTVYEMATGRLPFAGHEEKLKSAYHPPSALNPALPKAFDALLSLALDPDPARRLQSARELSAGLDSVAKGVLPAVKNG